MGRLKRSMAMGLALVMLMCGTIETAEAYTLKQRSYRARDGRVIFACVTAPFDGTIAFVASDRYRSGIAAIVVPASNYPAFLRRRYPASWYEAAANDISNGISTPAARLFDAETRKIPSVMFMAEGDAYGNYDRPHLPLDPGVLDQVHSTVAAAISNCSLRRR